MRLFAIVLLLLFPGILQQSNPSAPTAKPGVKEWNSQHKTADSEQWPNPTIAIKECSGCFPAIETPRTKAEQSDAYDPRHDTLYRAYLWFTICGVLVGLLGIGAIYKQTKATADSAQATARSASAMEKSVGLQEIAQKQWVNLDKWEVHMIPTKQRTLLEISFQIVNPTDVPLTLRAVMTKLGGGQREDINQSSFLTPGNPYVASVGINEVTEEQKILFSNNALSLIVECTIFFTDALEKHWQQDFGRMLLCGAGGNIITDTKNTLRQDGDPQKTEKS